MKVLFLFLFFLLQTKLVFAVTLTDLTMNHSSMCAAVLNAVAGFPGSETGGAENTPPTQQDLIGLLQGFANELQTSGVPVSTKKISPISDVTVTSESATAKDKRIILERMTLALSRTNERGHYSQFALWEGKRAEQVLEFIDSSCWLHEHPPDKMRSEIAGTEAGLGDYIITGGCLGATILGARFGIPALVGLGLFAGSVSGYKVVNSMAMGSQSLFMPYVFSRQLASLARTNSDLRWAYYGKKATMNLDFIKTTLVNPNMNTEKNTGSINPAFQHVVSRDESIYYNVIAGLSKLAGKPMDVDIHFDLIAWRQGEEQELKLAAIVSFVPPDEVQRDISYDQRGLSTE